MKTKSEAKKILRRAEDDLRMLIVEAAKNADYAAVELVAAWASQVNAMHAAITDASTTQADHPDSRPKRPADRAAVPSAKRKKQPRKKRGAARGYPKFVRSGDSLVKVAWSKSQKSEYRHKSPRSVLTQLVGSLSQRLADDSVVVSMEEILPLKGPDGIEIPDYQPYLCLAWLRSIGAVKQKGRAGYTRSGINGEVRRAAERSWDELPEDK